MRKDVTITLGQKDKRKILDLIASRDITTVVDLTLRCGDKLDFESWEYIIAIIPREKYIIKKYIKHYYFFAKCADEYVHMSHARSRIPLRQVADIMEKIYDIRKETLNALKYKVK